MIEESKAGALLPSTQASSQFSEREISDYFMQAFTDVSTTISHVKSDSNCHSHGFRAFTLPKTAQLGFPSMTVIRKVCGEVIQSLYIFQLHVAPAGCFTHALYLKIHGFAPRRRFETFVGAIVRLLSSIRTIKVLPLLVSAKKQSLQDYLQSLYVLPGNLLVNYSHQTDAMSEDQRSLLPIDHQYFASLRDRMKQLTNVIIENFIQMPGRYPATSLSEVLSMDASQYRLFMRTTTLLEITEKLVQDAYSLALNDRQFKPSDTQALMNPTTRRAMINSCVKIEHTKQIQKLLHQQFNDVFAHPHPFNQIYKNSQLSQLSPMDGMIFDPRFMIAFLLTVRWFARSCMRREEALSNNHAHLVLYGATGTGKSLMSSVIGSNIPVYKFLHDSRFQSPELLQSSILALDECDTTQLPTNKYKLILDIKSFTKIDMKGLHPENATEGMPSIITTNDEVYTQIRMTGKSGGQSASIEAALRRLYIVPMKMGQFEKLHGQVPADNQFKKKLGLAETQYDMDHDRLNRMFNLLLTLSLFQRDLTELQLDNRICTYLNKLLNDFDRTIFGQFYYAYNQQIRDILKDFEDTMMNSGMTDTEYTTQFALAAGTFSSLQMEFLKTHAKEDFDPQMMKDGAVPWPAKICYLKNSQTFMSSVRGLGRKSAPYINQEVSQFLQSPENLPFLMQQQQPESESDDMDPLDPLLGQKRFGDELFLFETDYRDKSIADLAELICNE